MKPRRPALLLLVLFLVSLTMPQVAQSALSAHAVPLQAHNASAEALTRPVAVSELQLTH
jgi:hypothetical protein